MRVGALGQVAVYLPLAGGHCPQKRHQSGAAVAHGVAPVGFLERLCVLHFAVFHVHKRRICAVEDLLPAKSVCHDIDNVPGMPGLRLGENGSRDAAEGKCVERAGRHFHSFH
jgi:hypothetical protein